MSEETPHGWGRLANSRKWHFIALDERGRQNTLCGKAVLFRSEGVENEADNHGDNCATCKRKVKAWREKHDYWAVDDEPADEGEEVPHV